MIFSPIQCHEDPYSLTEITEAKSAAKYYEAIPNHMLSLCLKLPVVLKLYYRQVFSYYCTLHSRMRNLTILP